ncbi:hypothetical protein ACLOJK_013684 [Asimina triloba]
MSTRNERMLPLGVLLKRESTLEKIENPDVTHGQASQSKKGEDFTLLKAECQRVPGDGATTFSVFGVRQMLFRLIGLIDSDIAGGKECSPTSHAIFTVVVPLFDGHNGSAAAIYSKENLLNNILGAIPSDLSRDEWLAALPRALVAGFVKTDKDLKDRVVETVSVSFLSSGTGTRCVGTTVTFAIIDGWVVTVASVGDSCCIFESADGTIYSLSADHRLETNEEERDRITASGGEVGRLNTGGGSGLLNAVAYQMEILKSPSTIKGMEKPLENAGRHYKIGPLRCWPGGLCLSRSIGDLDVGEFIVPIPYVKQVKLSTAGGRLVISSDGVWDALSFEVALNCCRGLTPEPAAAQIVKEAIGVKGIRDDTTCIVVDILPPEKQPPPPPKKGGKGVFKSMFRKRSSESSSQYEDFPEPPDLVEEIFEEGSALLEERLESDYPVCNLFKLFMCAVCQVEMKPGEGISIHAGSSLPGRSRPWDGPFLCTSCQAKKESMEGKRSMAGTIIFGFCSVDMYRNHIHFADSSGLTILVSHSICHSDAASKDGSGGD